MEQVRNGNCGLLVNVYRFFNERRNAMKKMMMMLLMVLVCLFSVVRAEATWWTYEYDGSVDPTLASPAWVNNSGSGSSDGDVWTNAGSKWQGYKQTKQWPGGVATIEIRFKFYGTGDNYPDDYGVLYGDEPKQWQAQLKDNGTGKDLMTCLVSGGGTDIDIDEDWNIVRFLYGSSSADVYLLSGGALSGNGGAWSSSDINPVLTGWVGMGAGDSFFEFSGNTQIDYIRWTNGQLVPPVAVPEPATIGLLLLGIVGLIRRR